MRNLATPLFQKSSVRNRVFLDATKHGSLPVQLLPRSRRLLATSASRRSLSESGENKSGHIEAKQNEGILFFDCEYTQRPISQLLRLLDIFPLGLGLFFMRPLNTFIDADTFFQRFLKKLDIPLLMRPEKVLRTQEPVKILETIPRYGDGGAFVKFSYDPCENVLGLQKRLSEHLKEKPIRPWFNPFHQVRSFVVQGRPWVEDLRRVPCSIIKVEFVPKAPGQQAQELSSETLFSLFRQYGKLAEIAPQPTDSKELPRYATVSFYKTRDSVIAKNCLHGYATGEDGSDASTILKISYQQRRKAHWIWDWIINHPRITIPVFVALAGTLTVAIFDP